MASNAKQGVDPKVRQGLWLLAEEFPDASTLIKGFRAAKLDKERIAILTIEALTQRCKSPASTWGAIQNVGGVVKFFLETRDGQ